MEVHKDENTYKCTTSNECTKREIIHLKEDKSVHTGGEQYNLDSRGTSSNLSPGAKKYRRVYTGYEPDSCNKRGKASIFLLVDLREFFFQI